MANHRKVTNDWLPGGVSSRGDELSIKSIDKAIAAFKTVRFRAYREIQMPLTNVLIQKNITERQVVELISYLTDREQSPMDTHQNLDRFEDIFCDLHDKMLLSNIELLIIHDKTLYGQWAGALLKNRKCDKELYARHVTGLLTSFKHTVRTENLRDNQAAIVSGLKNVTRLKDAIESLHATPEQVSSFEALIVEHHRTHAFKNLPDNPSEISLESLSLETTEAESIVKEVKCYMMENYIETLPEPLKARARELQANNDMLLWPSELGNLLNLIKPTKQHKLPQNTSKAQKKEQDTAVRYS